MPRHHAQTKLAANHIGDERRLVDISPGEVIARTTYN